MKEIFSRIGHRLFTPPDLGDQDKTLAARQVFNIVRAFALSSIFLILVQIAMAPVHIIRWLALLLAIVAICLVLLQFSRRGHVRWAAFLLVMSLWLLIGVFSWTASGLGARAAWGYFIVVFIAGMLLGRQMGIITAGLCSAATLFIALASPSKSSDPVRFWLINTLYLAIVLLLQNLASRSIRESLQAAKQQLLERQQAEETLRVRNQFISSLLRAIPVAVFFKDRYGKYTGCNDAFTEIMGVTSDEIKGKTVHEIWPSELADTYHQKDLELMQERKHQVYEFQVQDKHGQLRSVIYAKDVFMDANGGIGGLVGAFLDITDRKLGEEKLQESEQRYRTLFESAGDAIFLLHKSRIIDCNSRTMEMFGCTREQIVGMPISRFHPPRQSDNSDSLNKGMEKNAAALSGDPQFFYWQHIRFDGTPFDAEVSLNRVELGSDMHLLAIVRDITDRKVLEEQLRQAQKMEAVGILAGGVAHDFNNILSSIVGYASLMQMLPGLDKKIMEYLERILASTERAASLTHSLLAFSRKQAIELQPVDINDAIFGFHKVLERLIGEDIDFKLKLTSANLVVDADIRQIEQVLMNLATNSRDAMPHGGKLTITTRTVVLDDGQGEIPSGSYAVISVSDTGTGMDSEIQSHLFEPFYTTKEVGKGTGLGLAIVYGIIKNHKGFIRIESKAGRRTTFHIYVPLKPLAIQKDRRKKQPRIPRGTETILLVEDDAAVRHATRAMLEEFGYTVLEAADGMEALDVFEKHRDQVRLLLCDLIMPKKNGKETRAGIVKLKPDIKTLFMSGYTNDIIARKGILDPGMHLLLKPLHPAALLEKIREVLDS